MQQRQRKLEAISLKKLERWGRGRISDVTEKDNTRRDEMTKAEEGNENRMKKTVAMCIGRPHFACRIRHP